MGGGIFRCMGGGMVRLIHVCVIDSGQWRVPEQRLRHCSKSANEIHQRSGPRICKFKHYQFHNIDFLV